MIESWQVLGEELLEVEEKPAEIQIPDSKDTPSEHSTSQLIVTQAEPSLPSKPLETEVLKKLLEIDAHFQAQLQTAKIEVRPPDFSFPDGEFKGPQKTDATTIWESWYGIKEDGKPFESLNHYSYGAVVGWLLTTVVGIKPDYENPGFKHFYLEPKPGGNLTNAEGSFDSPYGLIQSSWSIESGKIRYEFRVPPNSSATITLDGLSGNDLEQEGISNIQDKPEGVSFQVQSGTYTFTGENVK